MFSGEQVQQLYNDIYARSREGYQATKIKVLLSQNGDNRTFPWISYRM